MNIKKIIVIIDREKLTEPCQGNYIYILLSRNK